MSDNESEIKEQIKNVEESNDLENNDDIDEKRKKEEYYKLYHNSYLYNNWIDTNTVSKIRNFCIKLPGVYYCLVHTLFMILIGIIIFFVTNKSYLCMTLLVISLDAIANVVFFDCPLSSLEKKYLNSSMIESRLNSIQQYGMMYANNRIYDTQLEVIINGWTLCAAKILCLIVFDWFNINY
jgi:hypothetical protein